MKRPSGARAFSLAGASRSLLLIAAMLVPSAATPAHAATSLVNLLQNPGAEQQPVTSHGWTTFPEGGNWTIARGDDTGGIGTHSGDNFFWAGQSLNGGLYQIVDLTGYRAWMGDSGAHSAYLVGYIGSYSGDGDTAWIAVEALDKDGFLLGFESSAPSSPDVWTRVELKLQLPAGTAKIRVGLYSERVSGSDNNGYFDDVGLYLPPPNLLVNPGAELQPVTSHGWTTVLGYWGDPRGDDAGGIGTHSGDNFFWGGQTEQAWLQQVIDLGPYRGWTGDGNAKVEVSGYVGSWSGDGDTASFVAHFRNESEQIVGFVQSPQNASPDVWTRHSQVVTLPATAVKIEFNLFSNRVFGTDNNGYFDDLGVYLPAYNLLQNPGAEVQPVTSNGWTASTGDWTIARGDDDGGIGTHSGDNFFWAGSSASGWLDGYADVASYAGWLGNAAQEARLVGYKGSWSGDGDTAEIVFAAWSEGFVDAVFTADGASGPDVWTRSEQELLLPAWTSVLDARLLSTRVSGSHNNGYFDDLHLQVEAPDWLFDANTLFADGFEIGSANAWSAQVP